MAIDAATVRRVARLARIAEPEARLEPLAREIDGIVRWVEQLNEVDVEGVEPMTSAVAAVLPMRERGQRRGDRDGVLQRPAPTRDSSWCPRCRISASIGSRQGASWLQAKSFTRRS